ncbi:MAG: hypothetical protein MUE71_04870 [Chitinophagaceae bacterium]|jgi:hypothetical protein|nr:hypothetical protein [Chitinophagaceae bacterium]MCU0403709.1 hypothetical protein [Chitinophagaceae bacterium]
MKRILTENLLIKLAAKKRKQGLFHLTVPEDHQFFSGPKIMKDAARKT